VKEDNQPTTAPRKLFLYIYTYFFFFFCPSGIIVFLFTCHVLLACLRALAATAAKQMLFLKMAKEFFFTIFLLERERGGKKEEQGRRETGKLDCNSVSIRPIVPHSHTTYSSLGKKKGKFPFFFCLFRLIMYLK
jgi:hypothetical protein